MRRNLEPFQFKKFSVSHNNSTIAVGTDAVLLASWANLDQKTKILDVGTGCGLIALCLAERLSINKENYAIHALDIDWSSLKEARKNFSDSLWSNQLTVFYSSFENHLCEKYDLIISNPPFFRNSQKNEKEYLKKARHQIDFNLTHYAQFCKKSITNDGKVALVYPEGDAVYLESIFKDYGFNLIRKCFVYSKKYKIPSRVLLEFSLSNKKKLENSELVIYSEKNSYTDSYRKLTKQFYLNF